ncbi:right-handed parallel beta-helix repeat-containing protein [Micromonospora sp. DPT]|uniref:right-handed parallel beta-helix repeat-containing protein n=1 Tax=Micromonospora sp. DPT TaxID=3142975 RepID=UPI00320AAF2C
MLVSALAVLLPLVAHVLELRSNREAAPPVIHTFHVSPTGDDARDGSSPAAAWRSLDKASAFAFKPGDKLLLEGGAHFRGSLTVGPGEAGDAANPVVVGTYGGGRATIEAAGGAGIRVHNTAGVEIRDLVIVGGGADNRTTGGIELYSDLTDGRKLDHVHITGVEVSGFKNGIQIAAGPNSTGFRGVRIRAANLHGNTENGLISFGPRFDAAAPRYAHEDVVVSEVEAHHNAGDPTNHFSNTGSGIALGSVRGGRIERSRAHDNGSSAAAPEGPVGIWTWDSTAVVMERNVSFRNHTAGQKDGGGFDMDQNVSSSVLQYNLSYDNDGAGYLLYSGQSNAAHTDNVVRFNISINDARKLPEYAGIHLAGSVNNAEVYHNTVVMEAEGWAPAAVRLQKFFGGLSNVVLRNNLLVSGGTNLVIADEFSTANVLLQGNNFFAESGTWAASWAGVSYVNLEDWRAATGQERVGARVGGSSVDPRFGRADRSGSPAQRVKAVTPRRDSPLAGRALNLRSLFNVDPGPVDFLGRPLVGAGTVGAIQPAA